MTRQAKGRAADLSDALALLALGSLAVIVLLQFVTRYMLNDSLAWTEEVARYLLIAMVYAGSVTALLRRDHIALEMLYRYCGAANVRPMAVMAELVTLVFHGTLAVAAIGLTSAADGRMVSVDVPKSFVYGFVAMTLVVATAAAGWRLSRRLRQTDAEILDELGARPSADIVP